MVPIDFRGRKGFPGVRTSFPVEVWGAFVSMYNCRFLRFASLNSALMVKRCSGSVVAVLSPKKKFLSSVFIYGNPVRNNDEILFLSGSYHVPLMC